MPNVIISGPPGTGKTTSIGCLAREMLGDAYSKAVLELNASDDRGIDVVRNRIKMFAQKRVTLPPGKTKIIILDEADSMTSAAQQAMRRTMEIYSSSTRFALACNLSSKIIEPIQSRCAILRYTKLSNKQLLKRLIEVCRAEQVSYDDSGLEAILFTAEGDMRHALNNLQATNSGFGHISAENVWKVCDQPHPVKMKKTVDKCLAGELDDAVALIHGLYVVVFWCWSHSLVSLHTQKNYYSLCYRQTLEHQRSSNTGSKTVTPVRILSILCSRSSRITKWPNRLS